MSVLTESDRKAIRAGLYKASEPETTDFTDGKIAFMVSYARGRAVLDLGSIDHHEDNFASRFWLFRALREVASRLKGLDYYEKGVKVLRERGFPIEFADAQNFSLGETFEVVTAGDLIEHIPNLDGLFRSISRHLITGGMLVVATPNPWCWKYLAYHLWKGRLTAINKEHVAWFCPQTIALLGGRYGFELERVQWVSRRNWEKWMPLPSRLKHTTVCVALRKVGDLA
jgi:SAM-dependent methyltransferase